jgi:hypothetical protein
VRRPFLSSIALAASIGVATLAPPVSAAAPQSGDWHAALLASFDDVWQTVHDTFYDPTFGGVNWDAVRGELRCPARRACPSRCASAAAT